MDFVDDSNTIMGLAVEASPNGMVLTDQQGIIVMVNSAIETMFGYQRSELLECSIEQLVPERYRPRHPQLRDGYFTRPQARAMGQGRDLFARHKDGHEFPVEIGLNPIHTHRGTLVLASIVDITERYRAQEMMRLAVEAAPNGMLLTDVHGTIVMANTMATRQFGYPREQLVGANISLLIPERNRQHHPQLHQAYMQKPISRAMGAGRDLNARHRDGREFPVEIGLNPITTQDGLMILASVVDITERKKQEQKLKASLEEKEVMLSEIHHRVKNNLQIIDSLLGMQLDNLTDDRARTLIEESRNRVRSMAIIHQTLYQSRDLSEVDMAGVVNSIVNHLAHSFGVPSQTAVQVKVETDELLLPLETSIPLGLVLNELVANALEHAFPAGHSGEILVQLQQCPDGKLALTVADDGIGLPHDFHRDDSLGLRLVEALSDQLEADLSINHSNPTRFHLQWQPGE
ncbi:MAG: PAS domain S-box protein [Pseudomonadota bacterium]|nr:PAS domain S-box protein [Pseudomonadota bacterium]